MPKKQTLTQPLFPLILDGIMQSSSVHRQFHLETVIARKMFRVQVWWASSLFHRKGWVSGLTFSDLSPPITARKPPSDTCIRPASGRTGIHGVTLPLPLCPALACQRTFLVLRRR
jgi:hypothetical protein